MGMDRKLNKSRKPLIIKSTVGILTVIALVVFGNQILSDTAISSFRVDEERVRISTVAYGAFEDFIPVRGSVTPWISVYLDAIDGGRVEAIFVEEGAQVYAGQPILELSNTSLQLDVISREAQVTEQLNNLRNTRLAMEQNRLSLRSQLVDIDYQIKRLERLEARRAELVQRQLISMADYEETLDELEYHRNRREVTIESQQQDETMRVAQIESLESGVDQLDRNLNIARENLENLVIKAPISGQLTSLNADIGQSKNRGETLGQIDDVEQFKLSVFIDEFYVTRIRTGLYGEFTLLGEYYELNISKVYPEIVNGQFEVEMEFVGLSPTQIRRGQTLQIRLQLGDANNALLLPRGSFFQNTGGNWVFVLDESGDAALKRNIRLGRQNPEYYEVLEGLEAGDRVITSEYGAYTNIDRILLN